MIETPQIIETETQLTASIPLRIAKDEIQEVMGPGVRELMGALDAQGIAATGPWFTHHTKIFPEGWDFEIGATVAAPVSAAGRVRPGEWPALRMARTVYHGGYEGLGDAWGELEEWIEARGHTSAEDLWERYLVGPESDPDPAAWRTELNRPLR